MCVVRGPTFSPSSGEKRLIAVDWPGNPVGRGYGQLDIPKGKGGPSISRLCIDGKLVGEVSVPQSMPLLFWSRWGCRVRP
jgi:hypothetical protein